MQRNFTAVTNNWWKKDRVTVLTSTVDGHEAPSTWTVALLFAEASSMHHDNLLITATMAATSSTKKKKKSSEVKRMKKK